MDDNDYVDCVTCREAISARLDGEADPSDLLLIDGHLPTCPECQAWEAEAARLSRSIRVRPAVPTPDLTAAILSLAAAEKSKTSRSSRPVWRGLLALIGLAQFTLGMAQLIGVAHTAHGDGGAHLFNESTAWNIALGIGFAAAAVWSRLAAGLLPTLAVFAAVLTAVSVGDVLNGQVDAARLESHVLVLLGLAVLFIVHRQHERENGPRERQRLIRQERYSPTDAMPERVDGKDSKDRRGLRPAGRHVA